MADIADGETVEVQGSGSKPYALKNTGGVYSCSCPAWRNQSTPIERRTCKHLKGVRGAAVEAARCAGIKEPASPGADHAVISRLASAGLVAAPAAPAVIPPPLLLANSWNGVDDLTGWWMSEKLDGVRAFWNGTDFISRLGNVYHAPDWFKANLPSIPLDGELWIGRKAFQETVSIVRRQDKGEQWRKIKFLVFDTPEWPGLEVLPSPFEARYRLYDAAIVRAADSVWGQDPGHDDFSAFPMTQTLCQSNDHLREELRKIEALGGEGLMLRQPGSLYVAGRSETLLKVKSFHDAEARVVGHTAGKGRHKGRAGALEVESLPAAATGHGGSQALKAGVRFSVGTGLSDAERSKPPPLGTVITFRYQELTDDGVPRFPTFGRIRPEGV